MSRKKNMTVEATKRCSQCGETKPTSEFYRNRTNRDGLCPRCKQCWKIYQQSDKGKATRKKAEKKYYKTDKGKQCKRKKDKKYYQTHKTERTEYCRAYRRTLNGYLHHIFGSIQQRCSNPKHISYKYYGKRGIECRFTDANDFICFIMGVLGYNSAEKLAGLQIDRVNNDGHYEMGNIRFVTAKVNANNRGKKNNMNLFDAIISDRPIIVDGEVMLEAIVPVTNIPWQDSLGCQPLSDIAAQTYGLDKHTEEDKAEDEKKGIE